MFALSPHAHMYPWGTTSDDQRAAWWRRGMPAAWLGVPDADSPDCKVISCCLHTHQQNDCREPICTRQRPRAILEPIIPETRAVNVLYGRNDSRLWTFSFSGPS